MELPSAANTSDPQHPNKEGAVSITTEKPHINSISLQAQRGQQSPPPPYQAKSRSYARSIHVLANLWRWELLTWTIGSISFVCTIALFIQFDDLEQRKWNSKVKITAFTAVLAQVSQSALLVPIASSIGQWKWRWFETERPAIDIDRFDTASRGPDGCLRLLYHLSTRPHLVSLGALSTLLLLAFPAFIQQAVAVEPRLIARLQDGETFLERSTFWNSMRVTGDSKESLAVIRSMMNEYLNPANVTGACSTGQCTWERYRTLAVCAQTEEIETGARVIGRNATIRGSDTTFHSTVEITQGRPYMERYWGLENNTHIDVPSIADVFVDFYDPCLEGQTNGSTFIDVQNPKYWRTFRANMHICVHVMESSYNSSWTSRIINTAHIPQWYKSVRDTDSQNDTCTTHQSETFCIAADAPAFLGKMLQSTYEVNASIGTNGLDRIPDGTQWSRLVLDDIRMYGEVERCPKSSLQGFDARMQRIATSVSLEMRDEGEHVNGTAWESAQVIEVGFRWLIAPILIYSLITFFFITTILYTLRAPPWKSSALALLQSSNLEIRNAPDAKEMQRRARTTQLQLVEKDDSWVLEPSDAREQCQACVERSGDLCSECRQSNAHC